MPDDTSLASQRWMEGKPFRTSVTGEPRAPLCGMGVCMECRATVDGVPHQRTCQVNAVPPAAGNGPGTRAYDVLVVGAGPAGIAAAWAASQSGKRVGVVDDNPSAGGQIWRGALPGQWQERLRDANIEFLPGVRIFSAAHSTASNGLFAEEHNGARRLTLTYDRLILATGARERFIPFPGWTLPGVFGAGGLQAMVKTGLPIAGKRIVVAGSGPLLLAVAAYLKERGGKVLFIAEQTTAGRRNTFLKGLMRAPAKLTQGLGLRLRLATVRYRMSTWVTRAEGDGTLKRVVLNSGRAYDADFLACGFGLVPNTELPALLGCRIDDGYVAVNHWQETTVPNVYCAGEPTGIGGLDLSLSEGLIAGFSATGDREQARRHFPQRNRGNLFRRQLDLAFALRSELSSIATEETIICRCEDIKVGQILDRRSWRDLKLQTRCGMGSCQGRVCGPAVQFLRGWPADSVRPPLYPVNAKMLL